MEYLTNNVYNPYVQRELELYHHGILGQRWGKKNGPPYPIAAGAHSASEKKAGWKKSLASGAKAVAKGIGKGTVATAKFANKAAIRAGIKPKKLMTDKELADAIERLSQEKRYKNALKGKFSDIRNDTQKQQKDKTFGSKLLDRIGSDVITPMIVGSLNYRLATKLAGDDEHVSRVKTILGNKVSFKGNDNNNNNNNNGNNNSNNNSNNNGNRGNNNSNGKKQDNYQDIWDTVAPFKNNKVDNTWNANYRVFTDEEVRNNFRSSDDRRRKR